MTDIVEFLTARLDEREQLARGVEHAVGDQYDALTAAMGTTYGLSMVSLYWRSHDPARVLAEVAAKRAIVELHQPELVETINADGDERSGDICTCCDEVWPCDTLKLLALPDDAHPDYKPTWCVD